jgi:hypothetical protein
MSRRALWVVFAFAVLSPGCVPVTEPVGDIDKAEPDKNLVGKWTVTKSSGLAAELKIEALAVSAPEVKGNPKGLMRASMNQGGGESPIWFFVATVGKHTYVNGIVGPPDGSNLPAFEEEGSYAEWKKGERKRYFVFRTARDGDKLTLDCGNNDTFTKLMKDAGIKDDDAKYLPYFNTPAGWFTKNLDKTAPDKIFDGTNVLELKREKK